MERYVRELGLSSHDILHQQDRMMFLGCGTTPGHCCMQASSDQGIYSRRMLAQHPSSGGILLDFDECSSVFSFFFVYDFEFPLFLWALQHHLYHANGLCKREIVERKGSPVMGLSLQAVTNTACLLNDDMQMLILHFLEWKASGYRRR